MSTHCSFDVGQSTTQFTSPTSPTTPEWSLLAPCLSFETAPPFNHTPPSPKLPSWADLDSDDAGSSLEAPKYDLRLGPRDPNKVVLTSWVDQDRTATYDPNNSRDPWLKVPVNCILRPKRPRPERPFNYLEYKAKRPKLITWQRGRFEGKRNIAILHFVSEHGKSILKSYGSKLNNWPGVAFTLPNGDPDWDAWWNSHEPVPESDFPLTDTYDLRDRGALGLSGKTDDDALGLEDLTLGHPAARGCKACFKLGHPCPLLDEGSRYPCILCAEDTLECELIMEPQVKGCCSSCRRKKIVCDFVINGAQRGPCKACQDASMQCVAGPKSGRTRTGPSLDAKLVSDATVEHGRSFVSCTHCRQTRKWCSLKTQRERPPCKLCMAGNISCTFEPLNTRVTRRRRQENCSAKFALDQMAVTFADNSRKTNCASSVKTMIKKLAHPIHFNYRVKGGDTPACHWCEDLVYGLLGLGELHVKVIDYSDKEGYIEVSGGHRALGHPASRMCDSCTLDRTLIAFCGVHELEPIQGMDPKNFAYHSVLDFMMPGMAATAPFEWCSVCPAPAFFRCCKKMHMDILDEEEDEELGGGNGCGLALCEFCAVTLVGEHDGNLEGMINAMRLECADEGFGLRADVDFLHPEGELVRRLGSA